jgi:hypothetical protein
LCRGSSRLTEHGGGCVAGRNKLLARHIRQALPYYEAKERSEKLRQKGLNKVVLYERRLREAKENYSRAMTGLNAVSQQVLFGFCESGPRGGR